MAFVNRYYRDKSNKRTKQTSNFFGWQIIPWGTQFHIMREKLYMFLKTPGDGTFIGRTSKETFASSFHFCIFILFLYLHFIVVSSFHFCIFISFLIFILLSFLFFICRDSSLICFSTSSLTLLWTITMFLHPFYTFSSAHCSVIRNTFIFNHSRIFLP